MTIPAETQRRARQYLLLRLLVAVLGLLLVTFYLSWPAPETRSATSSYLYGLLSIYLVVGLGFYLTFNRWCLERFMYRQQVLIDFVFQGALIWATGGVVSIFSPLLFVTLAASTSFLSRRGANWAAAGASAFTIISSVAYFTGRAPATADWAAAVFSRENFPFLSSYLMANVLGLFAIASLGAKLSLGLQEAEHLRGEIIEHMVEGLIAIGHDGRVVDLNSEARSILGIRGDSGDYSGGSLRDLLGVDSVSETQEAVLEIYHGLLTGRRARFEIALEEPDGRLRPVEVKIFSVRDEKGDLRCRVGLFSDLTLKREVEQAERRIRKLEELQVMAAGIAHEIRNPLGSIRGCVQEMSRLASTDIEKRCSDIVIRESDRLDRIIEDFLRYARPAPFDLVPLDLDEVLRDVAELLRKRPDAVDCEIELALADVFARVYGDKDRLVQVFLNIGINALQALGGPSVSGSRRLSVSTRVRDFPKRPGSQTRTDGVEICFEDSGSGISEADLEKIFTPFFTTKGQGTGLGLSVVERIVREHFGTVDIESKVGKGTKIFVRLPLLRVGESEGEALTEETCEELSCHA